LTITNLEDTIGVIVVKNVLFPDFLGHYKALSVYIASIAGISLSNARKYMQIMNSKEQLQKINTTKDKFISIIAHDLRGPISGIAQLLDLVNNKEYSFTQDELNNILIELGEASHSILDLLENLLQWAKNQKGEIDVNTEKLLLPEIAEDCLTLLKMQAANKNIKLISKIDNIFVYSDRKMIVTVLRNLIHNAIKFSNQGTAIVISAEKKDKTAQISVKDSGIGIKPEIIQKLFKIAENVSTTGTNREKGTGLGLILCKEFVEKNGGTIFVESELGKGSTFSFTVSAE